MNKFERAINKWRTATEKIYFDTVGATMDVGGATVTVHSDVPYHGDACVIEADYLKDLKVVDDLQEIQFKDGGLSWVGDITVSVPAELGTMPNVTPLLGAPVEWDKMDYVLKATSTDGKRPVLNAVCFEPDRIVATDGYRVHWDIADYRGSEKDKYKNYPTLIHNSVLTRIKEDFTIANLDGYSIITYESYNHAVAIKADWVEGSFPDYRALMPEENKHTFVMPNDNRLKKIAIKDTMRVEVDDKITIYAFDAQSPRVSIDLELDGQCDTALKFGINPTYLFEAMNGKDSVIGFNQPITPIQVGDNAIVMPKYLEK